MKLTRPSRLVTVFVMLFSLLFMQFAVTAYACPGLMEAHTDVSAAMPADMEQQDMSGCVGKDAVQPNLCQAYDQTGNQSLDKPGGPVVQSFVPVALVSVINAANDVDRSVESRPQSLLLTRTTAPPLSISNCCFRI